MNNRNLTLMTDLYELTMMQGYFKSQNSQTVIFDLFYRTNPSHGSYAVMAGLEQVIDYINNLCFSKEDIDYLREIGCFQEDFLEFLQQFKFSGNIYAIPEGSVIFPQEPLVKVVAPMIEAQLIETALLNIINHQCLIATKASRVAWAAKGKTVIEMGLRRAQGPDAGIYGARAAIIGGCNATSNLLAGKMFHIPVAGTHAHSWIMSFSSEYEAFLSYAKLYPDNCILLVDTYDTLKSGIPNAIRVFENLRQWGNLPKRYGIRLDSGDLAYLSKQSRILLDRAGFADAIISASSDLDEYLIDSLNAQKAAIDLWGVGTNLITSKEHPSFGGVYKLAAVECNGVFQPKIKLSENSGKISTPGNKSIYRIYEKSSGKIKADLIALEEEEFSEDSDLLLFDPVETWKKTLLPKGSFSLRKMLLPIFEHGTCVYSSPGAMEIQDYCSRELSTLWDENRRLIHPQPVYVDLSQKLYKLKTRLLENMPGNFL